MTKRDGAGELIKLIRRLGQRGARLVRQPDGSRRLTKPGSGAVPVAAALVSEVLARGLVDPQQDGSLTMSTAGAAFLRRHLAGDDGFAAQHQARAAVHLDAAQSPSTGVMANQDESPLTWLRRRKGRDGQPLIDAAAFAAGERLRSDFSRGQIMPRVTANWTAAIANSRRDGSTGGIADLTDAAMAARQRVERALADVGPEFAGLLLDFCCFLKGIEEIERERQWPARSAKVVLKLALSTLARHYGLMPKAQGPEQSRGVRHWGTDDYRPTID